MWSSPRDAGTAQLPGAERFAPTRPVRGQMVALRSPEVTLAHVVRSERGYLVPRNDGRILAGSTMEDAGYDKRVTPAGMQQILAAAVEMIPALAKADVVETWSGLRPGSPDHLPAIGPTGVAGLWMATGHYRNGILLAPVTAHVLAEWICSGKPPLEMDAYSPLRFSTAAHNAR
jgi:Glycine/D-amino acid oxidases (deaminating)